MRQITFLGILLSSLVGCTLLPHHRKSADQREQPQTQPSTSPAKPHHDWWNPLHALSFQLPFQHQQDPPRAQALQEVGIVRTVSQDGSYVIIELEPGILIPPGRNLLVTASSGEIARLKSAESQPPYFIANIESGQPLPGQIVKQ